MRKFYIDTNDLDFQKDKFKTGDVVFLSGTVYTLRDAAHKILVDMILKKQSLPFNLCGAVVYYAGPTPSLNSPVGSCGPTTSLRMDKFTAPLLKSGVTATIGKGPRSRETLDAFLKYGAVYFCAVGGAGAYASKHITYCKKIAFPELGCEAVHKLRFDKFPVVVAFDLSGTSLFD